MKISRRNFLKNAGISSVAIPLTNSAIMASPLAVEETDKNNFTLLFLGTGAADWNPKNYPADKETLLSGKFRGLSSMLLNKTILLDCGLTVPAALDNFNVDIEKITDILITHTHGDHFNIDSIKKIQSYKKGLSTLTLWIHESAADFYKNLETDTGCKVNQVKCFESFSINNLEIFPVEANHYVANTEEQCVHYIIKSENKTFFYAIDGGWFTIRTWNFLKQFNIDGIVWDTTWGSDSYYCLFSHNSIPMIRIMKRQLIKDNVINQNSKLFLSHLSLNNHPEHATAAQHAATEQFIMAYDGAEFSM